MRATDSIKRCAYCPDQVPVHYTAAPMGRGRSRLVRIWRTNNDNITHIDTYAHIHSNLSYPHNTSFGFGLSVFIIQGRPRYSDGGEIRLTSKKKLQKTISTTFYSKHLNKHNDNKGFFKHVKEKKTYKPQKKCERKANDYFFFITHKTQIHGRI